MAQPAPNLPKPQRLRPGRQGPADRASVADDVTDRDEVVLSMPASTEYVRLARLVMAGLASRMGFSVDEVDDLRIGIDELCFVLLGPDGGYDGTVDVRFRVRGDELLVQGEAVGGPPFKPVITPLSAQILREVCESYDLRTKDGHVSFRIRRRHLG